MTGLLEWLLDLQSIRLARDAPLLLHWERVFPPWLLFTGGLAALAWVVAAYRREGSTATRRGILTLLRVALIALIGAVLNRPSLVWQRNRVEPSFVAVLLDTSLSMGILDSNPDAPVEKRSRMEQVQAALLKDDAAAMKRLLGRNGVQLYGFSTTVEPAGFAGLPEAAELLAEGIQSVTAEGAGTDLPRAIEQVIEKAQGRRLAAIVVASDGRSTQPTSLKDALDLAAGRQVPIYPLRVGSPQPVPDVEVGPLRAQEGAFVNDLVAVETQLSARGLTEPTTLELRLIDERTETPAAAESVVLEPGASTATVEFRTKPTRGGTVRYRVEAGELPGERNVENNADRIDVAVREGGLKVLFVEGYPRYEYRYLKNALLRESTMQVSALLLEADEEFIQEGAESLRRFPDTPEELNRFDVVVFGDVDPRGGWLSLAQMGMLLDFVGNEGGGFGLIAGERAVPHRFRGTPLEKLIPVVIDPTFLGRYDLPLTHGFRPLVSNEGRRSRILRFDADRELSAAMIESLPELFWVARTLGPKPGASVLLEHSTLRTPTGAMPLVVTGRYGAGKLFFQATDDTWRWRRHAGELLHDGYWVHVARELMRDARTSSDRRYVLRTDCRTYTYGAGVRTQVEFLDAELLAQHPERVELELAERDRDGQGSTAAHFEAFRISPQSALYEGTYVPARPGAYAVEMAGVAPAPGERPASVLIRVERPDLESRRPEADHETLERMAEATGGRVLELDQLEEGLGEIRDRSVQIPDDVVETLWDSKLILGLFVLMISLEWGLRKAFGLL